MLQPIKESDWKILRELARVALDRFCRRVLGEAGRLCDDADPRGAHERYLALCRLIQDRDEELGGTFNDLRRSVALLQLARMRRGQLVTDEEFGRFSPETRHRVESLLEVSRPRNARMESGG